MINSPFPIPENIIEPYDPDLLRLRSALEAVDQLDKEPPSKIEVVRNLGVVTSPVIYGDDFPILQIGTSDTLDQHQSHWILGVPDHRLAWHLTYDESAGSFSRSERMPKDQPFIRSIRQGMGARPHNELAGPVTRTLVEAALDMEFNKAGQSESVIPLPILMPAAAEIRQTLEDQNARSHVRKSHIYRTGGALSHILRIGHAEAEARSNHDLYDFLPEYHVTLATNLHDHPISRVDAFIYAHDDPIYRGGARITTSTRFVDTETSTKLLSMLQLAARDRIGLQSTSSVDARQADQ